MEGGVIAGGWQAVNASQDRRTFLLSESCGNPRRASEIPCPKEMMASGGQKTMRSTMDVRMLVPREWFHFHRGILAAGRGENQL